MRTTAADVILTAIHFKGVEQVKRNAKELAEQFLCSEGYLRSVIRKVEKGEIVIKG